MSGISGASTTRPELSRLLAEAHQGRFAGILVWRLDRLGRSLRHLVTVVGDLLARGIHVISATEPHMDSTTPTGRLLRNIFASVAEYEREMIREPNGAAIRTGGLRPTSGLGPDRWEMLERGSWGA